MIVLKHQKPNHFPYNSWDTKNQSISLWFLLHLYFREVLYNLNLYHLHGVWQKQTYATEGVTN
jgi:hypothetical protein